MKKIIAALIMVLAIAGVKGYANITAPAASNTVTEQKTSQNLALELNKLLSQDDITKAINGAYFSYIRECKPYDISFGFNIVDIGMQAKLQVDGWVNDRCVYNVSGKITRLSENVRNMFGVKLTDSELSAIEPVFQCKFTKTQLDKIVNALEEESLAQMNQEIYSPANKDIEKKSQRILAKTLSDPGTCNILNSDELKKLFMKK